MASNSGFKVISGPPPIAGEGKIDNAWYRWFTQLYLAVNLRFEAVLRQATTTIEVPLTGFSLVIGNQTGLLLLTPAAGLAAGTVTLPTSPSDGFEQGIASTQTVNTLTVLPASGQTIVGAAALPLTAGVRLTYRYYAATSTWYKL